jgi:hypothetical protein
VSATSQGAIGWSAHAPQTPEEVAELLAGFVVMTLAAEATVLFETRHGRWIITVENYEEVTCQIKEVDQ